MIRLFSPEGPLSNLVSANVRLYRWTFLSFRINLCEKFENLLLRKSFFSFNKRRVFCLEDEFTLLFIFKNFYVYYITSIKMVNVCFFFSALFFLFLFFNLGVLLGLQLSFRNNYGFVFLYPSRFLTKIQGRFWVCLSIWSLKCILPIFIHTWICTIPASEGLVFWRSIVPKGSRITPLIRCISRLHNYSTYTPPSSLVLIFTDETRSSIYKINLGVLLVHFGASLKSTLWFTNSSKVLQCTEVLPPGRKS